ncbi:MAG: phosphate/phosphite/phosphonate ABC transporter substrate-binding protein [Hormoscilla sp.]
MKRRNLIGYAVLFLASCSVAQKNSTVSNMGPAKLRFAVTDVHSIEELTRDFGPFRQTLEHLLERKVEFVPVANFTDAIPALRSDRIDLVMAGPAEYVLLNARTKAVPVIAVTRPNYHSVFAVRADSNIESLVELKGKKIGMWKVGSTAGHLGTTKMLIDAGLNAQSDFEVVMLGKKCMQALKNGEVDACALSSVHYRNLLASEAASPRDFPLLAEGQPLPNDVFVANGLLEPDFIAYMRSAMIDNQEQLLESLLATPANDRFKGGQIVAANDADYNMIRDAYQAIGQGELIK